jgi:hypothetical protein
MADIITHQGDAAAAAAPGPAPGRKHAAGMTRTIYRLLGLVAALAIALTAFISGTGTAKATVGYGSTGHVYMNLTGSASQYSQDMYALLIQSLRNTSGYQVPTGVNNGAIMLTQSGTSLIRLDLKYDDTTLQLWFTANDLYLRGFTDTAGNTYSFNDFSLQQYMLYLYPANGDRSLFPANISTAYYTLPFASDYNHMSQAANRGRESMPISYNDMWNSMFNLAYAGGAMDTQAYARSLMFMIQFTSESARFNDVYGVMADIMGNGSSFYNGLPAVQQELENSWSQMSTYYNQLINGTNPAPLYIGPNAGTLYWMGDLQARLAEGIGLPGSVSPTGDWWHTEL